MEKLLVIPTITKAVQYGLKNIPSLLAMVFLWLVTIWIPYLNVGTTIGVCKSVIKIGKGEILNPLDIFKSENFKNLGDFFLLYGLYSVGMFAACAFMFIPGIVLGIGWGFAFYFFFEKGLSPTKCLKVSWKATEGEKWTIFWTQFLTIFAFCVVFAICIALSDVKYIGWLFGIVGIVVYLLMFATILAVEGVMYSHFSAKADIIFADKIAACGCKAPEVPAAPAPEAPAPEAPAAPEE